MRFSTLNVPTFFAACCFLTACAEWDSIRRQFSIADGSSQLIDAKQRTVLVSQSGDQAIVCAEPSPDALQAIAASLGGSVSVPESVSGSFAGSISGNAASIGLRTQSIQLLRDGFYRLCESYLSGAIDAEEYDILQRRYQANMIALLAIEQLTGVVRPPAVALTSTAAAEAGANIGQLLELRETLTRRRASKVAELDAEKGKPEAEKSQERIDQLTDDIEAIVRSIERIDRLLEEAGDPSALAYGSGQIENLSSGSGTINKDTVSDISEAVENISLAILETDYSGQLCFSYLRENPDESGSLTLFCQSLLGQINNRYAIDIQIRQTVLDLLRSGEINVTEARVFLGLPEDGDLGVGRISGAPVVILDDQGQAPSQ